jgi:signal transduction histidine kinase/FixJ family two-component response regulator
MLQIPSLKLDREQLVAVARATPYAMLGYAINVVLATVAFWNRIPALELYLWTGLSLVICGAVGFREFRKSGSSRLPGETRNSEAVLICSVLLALPWSILATRWLGAVGGDGSVVLIALVVGMAASGSILLGPTPRAAVVYAATILIPVALKFLLLGGRSNVVLAGLSVSFFLFLTFLAKIAGRVFLERLDAVRKTKEACVLAERATEAKSEFFATMSHEIRTPLNSIIGYTSLVLARQQLHEDDARDLGVVRDAGRALLSVVNDILDFSALEAGRMKLIQSATLLRPIVEGCLSLMLVEARKRGLLLSAAVDPILDNLPVHADGQRIRQVLLNLVGNAVKFTSEGRVVVEANCVRHSANSAIVRFSVQDTGPGIPAASLPDLFNRFSQLDSTSERRFGGSGLGLAICKRIVEATGGTIGVDSKVGVGSTFWFEIAFTLADAVPGHTSDTETRLPKGDSKHILVVDDVEPNRRLTATVLKTVGHRVTTAASGQEAIALLGSGDYDVVLMDVQMPGMNGLTATKAIKNLGGKAASVPIIGMTANIFPDDIAKCYAAGMIGHLGKPFDFDDLLSCIGAVLDQTSSSEPDDETVVGKDAERVAS